MTFGSDGGTNPRMAAALAIPATLLVLLGLWQGYEAQIMVVTVDTGDGPVANLQLMQIQVLRLIFASAAFGSGCVLIAATCIVERLSRKPGQA